MSSVHIPVMLDEVLSVLAPKDDEVYVDGTFGRGGYTQAFLESCQCRVIALDRDAEAIAWGSAMAEKYAPRMSLHHTLFSQMETLLSRLNLPVINGIVLDLGVSSPQIDQAERGFSFQKEGPLHMGMGLNDYTAADIVNTWDEDALGKIIWVYGEERRSRAVARAIAQRRRTEPFQTTRELAACVRRAVGAGKDKIDPATRTFQALRICVNRELEELEKGLDACIKVLAPGGRLIVVSFHSLEDRIVKNFLRLNSGKQALSSRYAPEGVQNSNTQIPLLSIPSQKALRSGLEACVMNPRSRSARLRWGVRCAY